MFVVVYVWTDLQSMYYTFWNILYMFYEKQIVVSKKIGLAFSNYMFFMKNLRKIKKNQGKSRKINPFFLNCKYFLHMSLTRWKMMYVALECLFMFQPLVIHFVLWIILYNIHFLANIEHVFPYILSQFPYIFPIFSLYFYIFAYILLVFPDFLGKMLTLWPPIFLVFYFFT